MSPSNILQVVILWATTGSSPTVYPTTGKPWDAQSTQVAPGVLYFTPSIAFAPTAQEFNWMFAQRDQTLANLTTMVQCADGQNWGAFQASPGDGYSGRSVTWCPAYGCWISGTNTGQPQQSGDAINWSALGGIIAGATDTLGFVTYSDGTVIAFVVTAGPTLKTSTFVAASQTWAAPAAGLSALGGTIVGNLRCFQFLTNLIFCEGFNGSSAVVAYSPDKAVTWTAVTFTGGLPSDWGSTSTPMPILHATSPTLALLVSPSSADNDYYTSPDGITWTAQAVPEGSSTYVGADYDAVNGVYYLALSGGASGRVYSSTTGLAGSWTLAKSFGVAIQGFAANGGELALMAEVNGEWRMMISTNGGVTWGFAKMPFAVAGGEVIAAGNGFLYRDLTPQYAVTHQVGAPTVSPLL